MASVSAVLGEQSIAMRFRYLGQQTFDAQGRLVLPGLFELITELIDQTGDRHFVVTHEAMPKEVNLRARRAPRIFATFPAALIW